MKTLLVMRHAKSSWSDASLHDHDRPLNARGKADAPRMAKYLLEIGWVPDVTLSSSAARARATALAVAEAMGFSGELRILRALYLAEPEDYVAAVRGMAPEVERVLVVGHNPGLEALIEGLAATSLRMPTAAVASLSLPIDDWSELVLDGSAQITGNHRPKEIEE